MTEQDRNKAWGFALFGDDVRFELGGKISLIGAYQSDMFFPEDLKLPLLIPKIVVLIMYYEIHGAISEDLVFRVTYGTENTTISEVPVLRKDVEQAKIDNPTAENLSQDSERIFHVRVPVTLSPFRVEKMGRLRVRAHYSNGSVLRLGAIGLKQVPVAEFQKMVGIPA